ncbi:MAG: alpha/beta hydrolase [Candidatus Thorarchaeota archaeon]
MIKKSFLDNPTVSNQIFFPPQFISSTLSSAMYSHSFIKDLRFKITKKITLTGYFYLNDKDLPTILLFHGNGELASGYYSLVDFFFDCGVNLAVVDYRGYGSSSGRPIYSSLISDALPIYKELSNWIVRNNINNSIFILGRSIGSVPASEIGVHNPDNLRGIIFSSGFASLYYMMTTVFRVTGPDITPDGLKEYSSDTRIKKFQKPVLIIHGTHDFLIPYTESNSIYNHIPEGVEKKLVLIEDANHNNIFLFKEEYTTPLKEFINKNK